MREEINTQFEDAYKQIHYSGGDSEVKKKPVAAVKPKGLQLKKHICPIYGYTKYTIEDENGNEQFETKPIEEFK